MTDWRTPIITADSDQVSGGSHCCWELTVHRTPQPKSTDIDHEDTEFRERNIHTGTSGRAIAKQALPVASLDRHPTKVRPGLLLEFPQKRLGGPVVSAVGTLPDFTLSSNEGSVSLRLILSSDAERVSYVELSRFRAS